LFAVHESVVDGADEGVMILYHFTQLYYLRNGGTILEEGLKPKDCLRGPVRSAPRRLVHDRGRGQQGFGSGSVVGDVGEFNGQHRATGPPAAVEPNPFLHFFKLEAPGIA
jgi:hypothetical protein